MRNRRRREHRDVSVVSRLSWAPGVGRFPLHPGASSTVPCMPVFLGHLFIVPISLSNRSGLDNELYYKLTFI